MKWSHYVLLAAWMFASAATVAIVIYYVPICEPLSEHGGWWRYGVLAAPSSGVFLATGRFFSPRANLVAALFAFMIIGYTAFRNVPAALIAAGVVAIYMLSRLAHHSYVKASEGLYNFFVVAHAAVDVPVTDK